MRTAFVLIVLLGLNLSPGVRAQDASPAGQGQPETSAASTATMEQTVEFIRDAYRHQGTWHTVDMGIVTEIGVSAIQEKNCVLTMQLDVRRYTLGETSKATQERTEVHLFLSETNPLSLSVQNDIVVVNKASVIKARVPIPVVPSSSMDLGTKNVFQGGFITEVNPHGIVFAASDGMSYRLKMPAKDLPLLTKQEGPSVPLSDARVGDYIFVWGKNKIDVPAGIWISHPRKDFTAPVEQTRFELTPLQDSEMAPRVAKALVHALVFCQKDKSPAPF